MGALPKSIKDSLPAVKFLLAEGVDLPVYESAGAACFDIKALTVEYQANDTALCTTGIQMEIPEGWTMLVFSRSGHGFNADTRLANSVGVIDSDYRGPIMVKLTGDRPGYGPRVMRDGKLDVIKPGDKVAQAMFVPSFRLPFEVVDSLSETERGNNGFGSTGA